MGAAGESTVTIEVLDACRAYRYEPFSVTQAANGVSAARLAPSAVKTAGLRGERAYTYIYICVPGGAADVSALLDFLQTDESAATQDYLQMESAYRGLCAYLCAGCAGGISGAVRRFAFALRGRG